MVRHRALVLFPLLCIFTLATIVYLVVVCIPHTETYSIHKDLNALAERQPQKTDSYSLQSIPALTLTMSERIGRSTTPPRPHHSLHNSRSLKRTIDTNNTRIDPTSITVLSQNPDINARGEWQQKQVEKYCHKYGLEGEQYQLPNATANTVVRQNLFRHLLFDDKRHLIFCFIPKVGCTNMRRFLFALQGIIPQESITWNHVSEDKYLGPGIQKASFLKKALTDEERIHKIKTYYKFMFVRNPLERLLSAFLNKLSSPIGFMKLDTFEMHKRTILQKYRPQDIRKWTKVHGKFKLQVSFSDYIHWIIDSDNALLNEHFASIINGAQPCQIRYHFYGNFKMYSSDMAQIMRKLNVSTEYFWDQSEHKPGHETKDYLQYYYSQLSEKLKHCLFKKFHQELDFYYHLYPEEKTSHVELLNLPTLIE